MNKNCIIYYLLFLLILSSCSSDSSFGADPASPTKPNKVNSKQSTISTSIKGYVVADYVSNAVVNIKNSSNDIVATVKTDDNGFYETKLSNIDDGIVFVEAFGGSYINEIDNKQTSLDVILRAVAQIEHNTSNKVNITPLTDLLLE